MRHILLDSAPLSALAAPLEFPETIAITAWAKGCLAAGHRIYVPEVIDYELRRELLRAGKMVSVSRLDGLKVTFRYLPISTAVMLRATDLWAGARRARFSTGDPKKLDIDVILAAHALTLGVPASEITIATTNVSHLYRFFAADVWTNITP